MFNILIRQSSAEKTAEKQQQNQQQQQQNNKKRKAPRNHQMIPCVSLADTSILGNMKERAKEMKVFGCSFKFWNNFGRGLNENKGKKTTEFLVFFVYSLPVVLFACLPTNQQWPTFRYEILKSSRFLFTMTNILNIQKQNKNQNNANRRFRIYSIGFSFKSLVFL